MKKGRFAVVRVFVVLVAVGLGIGFSSVLFQIDAEIQVQNGIKRAMVTTDATRMEVRIEFVLEALDAFGVAEWNQTRYDLESIRDQLRDLRYRSAPNSAEYQAGVANARGALGGIQLDGTARLKPFSVNWLRIMMFGFLVFVGLFWKIMEDFNKEFGGRASHHHAASLYHKGR